MVKSLVSLGNVELSVLQYVTDNHPIRVGEVAAHFARTEGKARTTVLTLMERLREKGYLTRKKIRGTWNYSPKLSKTSLLEGLISKFVEDSLEGSLSPFVAYLADASTISDSPSASSFAMRLSVSQLC